MSHDWDRLGELSSVTDTEQLIVSASQARVDQVAHDYDDIWLEEIGLLSLEEIARFGRERWVDSVMRYWTTDLILAESKNLYWEAWLSATPYSLKLYAQKYFIMIGWKLIGAHWRQIQNMTDTIWQLALGQNRAC